MFVVEGSHHVVPKCVQETMTKAGLEHVVFESVWQHFMESWVPDFGTPKMVRVDADGCFRSQAYRHCLERHGVEVDFGFWRSSMATWCH